MWRTSCKISPLFRLIETCEYTSGKEDQETTRMHLALLPTLTLPSQVPPRSSSMKTHRSHIMTLVMTLDSGLLPLPLNNYKCRLRMRGLNLSKRHSMGVAARAGPSLQTGRSLWRQHPAYSRDLPGLQLLTVIVTS